MSSISRTARASVPGLRQQTQFTCVATSVAACLQALDKPYDEDDVNKVLGALPMAGARWEEALAVVQYFGCRGMLVVPASIPMLRRWTSAGWPVLIAWNPESRPWSHMSVVFDVEEDNTVHVMDPNIPDPNQTTRIVQSEDFYRVWGEAFGDKLIVRRPAAVISREVDVSGRQVTASVSTRSRSFSFRDRMALLQQLHALLSEEEILTELISRLPERQAYDILRLISLDKGIPPLNANNVYDLSYDLGRQEGFMEVAQAVVSRLRPAESKKIFGSIAQEYGIFS